MINDEFSAAGSVQSQMWLSATETAVTAQLQQLRNSLQSKDELLMNLQQRLEERQTLEGQSRNAERDMQMQQLEASEQHAKGDSFSKISMRIMMTSKSGLMRAFPNIYA